MTQSIEEPWGISVFGAGTVRAEPGLARVQPAVDVLEPSPEEAFRRAGAAVTRLREVLRRRGVPDASVSGSRLALASEYDGHGNGRTLLGYRCQASYSVETEALDELERLIVDMVDAGAHRIDSVEFDVLDRPALRDEARRRAVADARRRAQVYAEAADVRLGPVLHVQDVEAQPLAQFRVARGGGPSSALAPGAVEVTAGVQLGFSLRH
ncbi:SIMPL domain-containing protein [Streptomyces olivaceus]|uniref:SIMPL domain-containing protein n=1 Tax=Streptomyces olivaceus TaxID=47716 RepID=UPI001CCB0E73|nr:SIMPL domain-containing protein [Streptomyces olivaceus]MBZ6142085.1 SIMPL domain-containing protein [Streptomyces olivaceus]MBZ6169856.1 SIMPL domain-containing protein [Streptomyces olivaceus]